MLKQLIDEKSNEIFVLQTAGKGTSCPACVWQTVLHAGTAVHTADKWQPALSLSTAHVYLTLWELLNGKQQFLISKQNKNALVLRAECKNV